VSTLPFRLRGFSRVPPRAVMIGCSTGGPQALSKLLPAIAPVLPRAPVLITQHMPAAFTTILAEHLQRSIGQTVREATDGEPIKAGTVYLAPGGRHLRVVRGANGPVAVLDDGPPIHFCKPSVDPMFASGAAMWGASVLGLVLTGMGADGAQGSEAIATAGGTMIAQDEATSVIWGMPAQAIATGSCSAVLPLNGIAETVVRLFGGQTA
jgi:two-component system chemotaxis response regulator CheB